MENVRRVSRVRAEVDVIETIRTYDGAGVVRHVGKRIVEILAAVPNFFGLAGRDIADQDRPRMWAIGLDEITFWRIARLRRPANESDAFSVERPLRRGVGVDAGRK